MRNDQHVTCLMTGSDRFHNAHGACSHMKCSFSAGSPPACDIISPMFEGLRPSLLHVSLPEAFPLPVVNFFQPILEVRFNADAPAKRVRGLTSTTHGAGVNRIP